MLNMLEKSLRTAGMLHNIIFIADCLDDPINFVSYGP